MRERAPATWEVLLEDDRFSIHHYLIEDVMYYRFGYYATGIYTLVREWSKLNPWDFGNSSGRGYIKTELISIFKFFKSRGMELSLETALWMAKGK